MYSPNAISFLKLSTLLLNVGTWTVIYVLKEEVAKAVLTFSGFINNRKHDLYHLYRKQNCCMCKANDIPSGKSVLTDYQWKFLFLSKKTSSACPKRTFCSCQFDAKRNIKEDDLDMTLAICLIINLCQIPPQEKKYLFELRDYRNRYFAHAKSELIDQHDFRGMFNNVACSIKGIASSHGHEMQHKVEEKIREIKEKGVYDDLCQQVFNWLSLSNEVTQDQINRIEKSFSLPIDKIQQDIAEIKCILKQRNEPLSNYDGGESVVNETESSDEIRLKEGKKKGKVKDKFNSIHSVKYGVQTTEDDNEQRNSFSLPCRLKKGEVEESYGEETVINLNSEERHLSSSFIEKCKSGSLFQIKEIIDDSKDLPKKCRLLHIKDETGFSAIHYAARRTEEAVDIFKALVSKGITVSDRSTTGITVLHIACIEGNIELCKLLVSKDKKLLNLEDKFGWTPISFAAYHGHTQLIRFLTKKYRKINLKTCESKVNILQLACMNGQIETCQYILSSFPEIVHELDQERRTVAHYAARGGEKKILNILFKKFRMTKSRFKRTSNGDINILQIACLYGHAEICSKIISKFPDMLHKRDEEGLHAFHYAAVGGNMDIISNLQSLLHESTFDYCVAKKDKIDILQMACVYRKNEMFKHIVQNIPKLLNCCDYEGWTIAHVAARSGNVQVLKFLTENHMDIVNKKDYLHRTVLHVGCLHGRYDICEFLVSKYPEMINQKDKENCRPIILAANGGNIDILKLLLEKETLKSVDSAEQHLMRFAAHNSSNCNVLNFLGSNYPELLSLKANPVVCDGNEQTKCFELGSDNKEISRNRSKRKLLHFSVVDIDETSF